MHIAEKSIPCDLLLPSLSPTSPLAKASIKFEVPNHEAVFHCHGSHKSSEVNGYRLPSDRSCYVPDHVNGNRVFYLKVRPVVAVLRNL